MPYLLQSLHSDKSRRNLVLGAFYIPCLFMFGLSPVVLLGLALVCVVLLIHPLFYYALVTVDMDLIVEQ